MIKKSEAPACSHCGAKMKKWKIPGDSTWTEEFHWVCFNDECSYFKSGWEWMMNKYQQRASYRNRMNPVTGKTGPLPVWSADAHKDYIVEDDDQGDDND